MIQPVKKWGRGVLLAYFEQEIEKSGKASLLFHPACCLARRGGNTSSGATDQITSLQHGQTDTPPSSCTQSITLYFYLTSLNPSSFLYLSPCLFHLLPPKTFPSSSIPFYLTTTSPSSVWSILPLLHPPPPLSQSLPLTLSVNRSLSLRAAEMGHLGWKRESVGRGCLKTRQCTCTSSNTRCTCAHKHIYLQMRLNPWF